MRQQRLYLVDILERIRRIEIITNTGQDSFLASFVSQDAVIRSFEVIGEVVKRLSPEMTNAYPAIPWRQITGFRDVLIYDYEEVDLVAVWRIVAEDLVPLKEAVTAMLAGLAEEDEGNQE